MNEDPDTPLTPEEREFLIAGGAPADSFDPERMAEDRVLIAESMERTRRVLPLRGPWRLREVIDALPDMPHPQLVELLNAPLPELDGRSPVEWLAGDGGSSVVIEALTGAEPGEVAARLWAEMQALQLARKERHLTGRDFEDAESELHQRMLEVVLHRAEKLWPKSAARDWMLAPNAHLDGARPYDVLRKRGPVEVLAALAPERSGPPRST